MENSDFKELIEEKFSSFREVLTFQGENFNQKFSHFESENEAQHKTMLETFNKMNEISKNDVSEVKRMIETYETRLDVLERKSDKDLASGVKKIMWIIAGVTISGVMGGLIASII